MATTNITSGQIRDGEVKRADLNTATSGSAVITKIIAGTGISLSSTGADTGTGDVTVNSTSGLVWNTVSGTSQSASVNNAYITNNASLVTVTIPSSAAVGDRVIVTGQGAGGFRIAQNASQVIHFGVMDTTTGTSGRLDSTSQYDHIDLVCITTNTDWKVIGSIGNITVT